jgi:hypothetical protein
MYSLLLAALSLFRTQPVSQVVPGSLCILHITDIHADPFYDGAPTAAASPAVSLRYLADTIAGHRCA